MKIGVMLPLGGEDGPGGGMPGWKDVRAVAEAADQNGLDSVWLADHFLYRDPEGRVYGMHESWTLLSAVAAITTNVELGNMVLCASFRDPGLTAKMAATLDEVSGGRLILGVGAGWHDPEYEAFGLPTDHRVGRFEEWLEIVARMVRGETVTFDGTYYRVSEANLDPAPPHRIPILVAGPPAADDAPGRGVGRRLEHRLVRRRRREGRRETRAAPRRRSRPRASRPARSPPRSGSWSATPTSRPSPTPIRDAITGTGPELAEAFTAYQKLGVDHLIVSPEPMTPRSVERIAEAKQLLGD